MLTIEVKHVLHPKCVNWVNVDGKLHRVNGVADKAASKFRAYRRRADFLEHYMQYGNYHRNDGPAMIHYFDKVGGVIEREVYFHRGRRHRIDGPAQTTYYKNGTIKLLRYFKHGKYHREGKPSIIEYDLTGNKIFEAYYENDVVEGTLKGWIRRAKDWWRADGR